MVFLFKGFSYAGLQAALYCFCGNFYGRYGMSTACTMPCAGDSAMMCGGSMTNTVAFTGLGKSFCIILLD
jgi:hypothetical protein